MGTKEKEIKEAMKVKEKVKEQQDEQRGVITPPTIFGVVQQFTRVTRQHGFREANNTNKRDLSSNAKTISNKKILCSVQHPMQMWKML